MPFDQILGQESAIAILQNALRNGRLAHAYLFLGPEGVGKRLTAVTLAKAMNCKSNLEMADSCERCSSCAKINSANHADVILLESDGEVLKIDQIRDMQRRLRFRPLEGGRRVCLIDAADRLNDAASNALLKTLEEPPDGTHLILISSRPRLLLPTILSRCQWVKFRSLSRAHIVQILKKSHSLEGEKATFYASLAGGSAGQALAFSNRVDFQKRLDWLRFFSDIPMKNPEEIFESCERISKEEEEVNDLLELWKLWIRDLTVFKVRGEGLGEILINHDLREKIAEEAKTFSFERLDWLFGLISDVQKAIALNANRQLALETLMLEMKKNSQGNSAGDADFLNDPRFSASPNY
jgi:DNA polymerase-3 subunit delta'